MTSSAAANMSSRLNQLIRVERAVADNDFDGAGSGEWSLFCEVYAEIQDMLPSRGERIADGVNIASRPARVRTRFRTDITAAMRFVDGDRVMQIISGPAEIGRREALEFMVEDYKPAGNAA
jgi:head-tail adaptor